MSIVILILKIIGFLFLALLLLLALLLFHPLFYQLEGEWKEDAELRGYFWWLFQILRVEFAGSLAGPGRRIRKLLMRRKKRSLLGTFLKTQGRMQKWVRPPALRRDL